MNVSDKAEKNPSTIFSKREISLDNLYRMEMRQEVRSNSLGRLGKSMSSLLHLKDRSRKTQSRDGVVMIGDASCPVKYVLKHRNSLDMMMSGPDSDKREGADSSKDDFTNAASWAGHSSCPMTFGDSSMGAQDDEHPDVERKPLKSSLKKKDVQDAQQPNWDESEGGHQSCPTRFDRFDLVHRNSLEMMRTRPDSWKQLDSYWQD